MPASDEHTPDTPAGQGLAITAQALYLSNLLVLPLLSFLVLLILYRRHIHSAPALAVCHLRQTVVASLWVALILIAVNALIILFSGYQNPSTWVMALLYFVSVHAAFVLLGTIGLAKAMAGKPYRFPLIGVRCAGVDDAAQT